MNRRDKGNDDDSSSSDSSYGPSASDTSRSQKETEAAAAPKISPEVALKKQLGSKGVSVRVRKSAENLNNNKAGLAALGEGSASDDDSSSLFVGPSDVAKGSSLLQLSSKDKADPPSYGADKRRDEPRFGRMRLGSKRTTKNEKGPSRRGATGGESRNDNGSEPLELDNKSEEKKDE
jgi:hypothetical protein